MSEETTGPSDGVESENQSQNPAEEAIDAAEQALSSAVDQANGQNDDAVELTPEEQAMLDMAKMAVGKTPGDSEQAPNPEEQAMLDLAKSAVGDITDSLGDSEDPGVSPRPMDLPDLQSEIVPKVPEEIALLGDVNLNVKIELGRTRMLVEDILRLSSGAVVELDKLAGDPVDVIVNGKLVARGEVLVLNDSFCVRISEILSSSTNCHAMS